jgi:2-polyprenyl-3-methyl-5-hydroxy-6-metoxy-1,4-benzoquinol methylase
LTRRTRIASNTPIDPTILDEDAAPVGLARSASDDFERVPCCACGADDATRVVELDVDPEYVGILPDALTRGVFTLVRCRRCALIYLNPRPRADRIQAWYPREYCCFAQLPPPNPLMRLFYDVLARRRAREVLRHLPEDGVALDFGCGTGHWLDAVAARRRPRQRLVGIDPNEAAIAAVRARGLEGHVGAEEALARAVAPGSVDVVLLNHVIEHVPDPRATLRALADVLRPDGVILGATPNASAWDAALFGASWVGWHVPRHFTVFDPRTFARLVGEAGLELASLRSSLEAASHWAMSLHTSVARRVGWQPRPGRFRSRAYPLLVAAGLGVTAVQSLVATTSVMSFSLRRPRAGASTRSADNHARARDTDR